MQLTRREAIGKIKEDYDKVSASMRASPCETCDLQFALPFACLPPTCRVERFKKNVSNLGGLL